MNITLRKVASGAAATVLVLGASFATVTSAQAADEGGTVVTACVNKKTGNMRIPSGTTCKSTERVVSWISADAPAPAKVVDGNGKKVPGIVTAWDDSALATVATGTGKYLWNLDFASGEYNRMYMNRGSFNDSKGEYKEGSMYIDPNCTVPGVRAAYVPGNAAVQLAVPTLMKYDEDGYSYTYPTTVGGLTYGLKKRVSVIPFYKYWDVVQGGPKCDRNYVWKPVSAQQPAGWYKDFNAEWLFPLDLNNELRKPNSRVAPLMPVSVD
jgi:hypothetical protein